MSRLKTFRVLNGRMLFKCYSCHGNKMMTIAPGVRTRTLRCSKCGETTRCLFNRRTVEREQQSGKVFLNTGDGREIEVDLFDVSQDGVGFDVPVREIKKIHVGGNLLFKCPWKPQLLSQGRYVVRSIKGQRVGAELQR